MKKLIIAALLALAPSVAFGQTISDDMAKARANYGKEWTDATVTNVTDIVLVRPLNNSDRFVSQSVTYDGTDLNIEIQFVFDGLRADETNQNYDIIGFNFAQKPFRTSLKMKAIDAKALSTDLGFAVESKIIDPAIACAKTTDKQIACVTVVRIKSLKLIRWSTQETLYEWPEAVIYQQ